MIVGLAFAKFGGSKFGLASLAIPSLLAAGQVPKWKDLEEKTKRP